MTTKPYGLHLGDCLVTLRSLPDNSVDSIVTDPPYGLSFMGKKWDYDVPTTEIWAECLRVLKPGGHLLAFAGTRTQHRMAVRIEDAGFEIRDMIAWIYGSGFPKSMDVSKAIDKVRNEDVEPIRAVCRAVRAAMDALCLKSRNLVGLFGGCNPRLIDHWAARDTDSQPSLPTWEQWQKLRDILELGSGYDGEVWRLNNRKGQPGDTWQSAEVIGQHEGSTPGFVGQRFDVRDTAIRAASEKAAQWKGWGTALKPALEPITVARKPLIGTVAANVLMHGTGAINVDASRVGGADGRWPANLIHDGSDEVVALFPVTTSGAMKVGTQRAAQDEPGSVCFGTYGGNATSAPIEASAGSASRFFYCAKTSRKDRNEGMVDPGPQFKQGTTLRQVENTATTGNNHPTVKPTDLMAYLCRLVTPPGGTVLDPFMGSGSTGKAAMREGFEFIGCELDEAYLAIAAARIEHELAKAPAPVAPSQVDLFA